MLLQYPGDCEVNLSMEININDNWNLYWGVSPLPTGAKALGIVERKLGERGALILLPTGIYVQGNAGSIRSLNQSAIKVALRKKLSGWITSRPATDAMPTKAIPMTDEEYELVMMYLAELRLKSRTSAES
jgi:hypothetical protein